MRYGSDRERSVHPGLGTRVPDNPESPEEFSCRQAEPQAFGEIPLGQIPRVDMRHRGGSDDRRIAEGEYRLLEPPPGAGDAPRDHLDVRAETQGDRRTGEACLRSGNEQNGEVFHRTEAAG